MLLIVKVKKFHLNLVQRTIIKELKGISDSHLYVVWLLTTIQVVKIGRIGCLARQLSKGLIRISNEGLFAFGPGVRFWMCLGLIEINDEGLFALGPRVQFWMSGVGSTCMASTS